MIRFACPRCQSQFDVPDTAAGSKTACPKCQQRLQVPVPPPAKTVRANVVGHQPAPPVASILPAAGIPVRQPVPQPPPVAKIVPSPPAAFPSPSSGGDMQQARRSRRRVWIVAAGGGLLLGLLWLVFRLVQTGGSLRQAGEVAENRSHTRVSEEDLVKRHILNNTAEFAEVTFLRWGPHILCDEAERLTKDGGPFVRGDLASPYAGQLPEGDFPAIIRVQFRVRYLRDLTAQERQEIVSAVIRDGQSVDNDAVLNAQNELERLKADFQLKQQAMAEQAKEEEEARRRYEEETRRRRAEEDRRSEEYRRAMREAGEDDDRKKRLRREQQEEQARRDAERKANDGKFQQQLAEQREKRAKVERELVEKEEKQAARPFAKGVEQVLDRLFIVVGKRVFPATSKSVLGGEDASDEWKMKYLKELAKRYPGIVP